MTATWKEATASLLLAFFLLYTHVSVFTALLVAPLVAYGMATYSRNCRQKIPTAPGPSPFPILGSLHLMDGYKVRFAFL